MLDTQLLNEQWWSSINAFQRVFIFIPKARSVTHFSKILLSAQGVDGWSARLRQTHKRARRRTSHWVSPRNMKWQNFDFERPSRGRSSRGRLMQCRWHAHVYINSCKTWLVSTVRAKVLSKLMETFKSVCKLIQSVWPEKLRHFA